MPEDGELAQPVSGDTEASAARQARLNEREAASKTEFQNGDIVMGVAVKLEDKYAQKCQIIEVLSRRYKVKMLTGTAPGKQHKFLKGSVKGIEPDVPIGGAALGAERIQQPPPEAAASASATSASATGNGDDRTQMQEIGDLFD